MNMTLWECNKRVVNRFVIVFTILAPFGAADKETKRIVPQNKIISMLIELFFWTFVYFGDITSLAAYTFSLLIDGWSNDNNWNAFTNIVREFIVEFAYKRWIFRRSRYVLRTLNRLVGRRINNFPEIYTDSVFSIACPFRWSSRVRNHSNAFKSSRF